MFFALNHNLKSIVLSLDKRFTLIICVLQLPKIEGSHKPKVLCIVYSIELNQRISNALIDIGFIGLKYVICHQLWF